MPFTMTTPAEAAVETPMYSVGNSTQWVRFVAPATGRYYIYKYGVLNDGYLAMSILNKHGNYLQGFTQYSTENPLATSILLTAGQVIYVRINWREYDKANAVHAVTISRMAPQ